MLKRLTKAKAKSKEAPVLEDEALKGAYPLLHEHLTSRSFGKGEPRIPSTLSIFTQDGSFKLFINEKNDNLSLCITGSSWDGLWEALEAALGDEDADWRAAPDWNGKKRK